MISRGRRFQTKSGKICVVKDFNENMTFFEDGSKIETKFLLDKRFFIDLGMPINESVKQRPMQNNIDKIDPDAFFKQRNPLFEQFNSLPKEVINNLPLDTQSEPQLNYGADFKPVTNTSAIIMDDPEMEKELIAQKYSHLGVNKNDAIQRQKSAFGELLEEENIPVVQPYKQPQPIQPIQNIQPVNMEENRATTNQIEPVMESRQNPYQSYIDPLISMFKKTKRNTDFKMTIQLEKKIPRLDTIEMLEDSYETSIIEYLAQEFTNEILSNPSIIKDKIVEELKMMLEGNIPKKTYKREQKLEEVKSAEVKSEDDIEKEKENK